MTTRSTPASALAQEAGPVVFHHALQGAVCAYPDEAKRLGWPVERVIIEIKRFSGVEDGLRFRSDPFDRAEGQRVVERVVTWCVEHYYRAVPRSQRPGR